MKRTLGVSILLAGAMLWVPVAHAAVKPTAAPSSSTRHVAHVSAVHHKRHVRTHHSEPNLHAQRVAPASQPAPARVPAHPRVPRSSHGATAPNVTHRDGGSRREPTRGGWGTAGLPVTAASALSIAVLGTCVHQRTRDRLRSVSEPLESRGPPRAGPIESSTCSPARGAHDLPPSASALNHPHGWSPVTRASRTPRPFHSSRPLPWPAVSPLAKRVDAPTLELPFDDPHTCSCALASSANSPFSAVQGPCAPSEAPERGRVPRRVVPSIRRNT